ncbi:hypothetical protein QLG07_13760 [Erwinia sp. V90_4]|uniref:hypothetical protein n=1 Tax=Erwinia sp. V90_4 TaxID=3044239 RepID=UPI00249DCCD3|nr:hypothetical protein [Erwinia sp. V90_4]MDI3440530.1 hypothetical protein [Erwinia sp. V90_4]
MNFFSKVLTLNKLHIIENIIGNLDSGSLKSDYYNVGYPVGSPPLLRGSIVIELNVDFLTDNIDFFNMGSPVDTGSIKFGFLKPNYDSELFLKMALCDYDRFYSLTSDLFNLPEASLNSINEHTACPTLKPVLTKYFPETVIDFMYGSGSPHAWIFEFCLGAGYAIKEKHIRKLFIPNTYLSNPTIRKLSELLRGKVVKYNPKYGIEGRAYR